jgi:hypothetical protein
MRKSILLVLVTMGLLGIRSAHALNQSVHYQIANDSCLAHGFPSGFCDQVAVATHNVDDYEFNIMAAHSQMENGQTACDGANAAIWRVFWFGQQIRQSIGGIVYNPTTEKITTLAQFLGRALHGIQDNCAHSGMPNPQHAWKSLDDVCHGTSESPDLVPEAATCAREETDAVMDAVFEAISDWGGEKEQLSNISEHHNHLTDYMDACNYLGSASEWDGVDRRWDNTIVRPFMRNEIVSAITDDNAQHDWVCNYAEDGLLVSYDDDVDTSGGANKCALISAVCLGKADGETTAAAATNEPEPPAPHTGCDVSQRRTAGAPAALLLLVAAALLWARRGGRV